jgi:hypothetical protein
MDSSPSSTPRPPAGLLQDSVLVHASPDDDAAVLGDRDGSGLVLAGSKAIRTARSALRRGFKHPILLDRRRYSGNSRMLGTARLSSGWLDEQRQIGVAAVLTDSGYVGEHQLTALQSILEQTVRIGDDVTAVLPLHKRWLRQDLHILITEIRRYGVPVALVLEDQNDPLGARVAVEGLIEVLQTGASVALLSTDMSALGAIAYGAQWTSVGVRPALRHLYPVSKGGGGRRGELSAFVAPLMSFTRIGRIASAWAGTQDSPVWECGCTICCHRTLDWFQTASDLDIKRHTFELLLDQRDELANLSSPAQRQQSWRSRTGHALYYYDELRLVEDFGWDRPGALKAWSTV